MSKRMCSTIVSRKSHVDSWQFRPQWLQVESWMFLSWYAATAGSVHQDSCFNLQPSQSVCDRIWHDDSQRKKCWISLLILEYSGVLDSQCETNTRRISTLNKPEYTPLSLTVSRTPAERPTSDLTLMNTRELSYCWKLKSIFTFLFDDSVQNCTHISTNIWYPVLKHNKCFRITILIKVTRITWVFTWWRWWPFSHLETSSNV